MKKIEIKTKLQSLNKSEKKYVLEYTRTANDIWWISTSLISALQNISVEEKEILAMREYIKIPNMYIQEIEEYYDTPSNMRDDKDARVSDYYNYLSFIGEVKDGINQWSDKRKPLKWYYGYLDPKKPKSLQNISNICKNLFLQFHIWIWKDIENKDLENLNIRLKKMYLFLYPNNWHYNNLDTMFRIE